MPAALKPRRVSSCGRTKARQHKLPRDTKHEEMAKQTLFDGPETPMASRKSSRTTLLSRAMSGKVMSPMQSPANTVGSEAQPPRGSYISQNPSALSSNVREKEIRIRDSVEWDSVFQSTKQNLNRGRVSNEMGSADWRA